MLLTSKKRFQIVNIYVLIYACLAKTPSLKEENLLRELKEYNAKIATLQKSFLDEGISGTAKNETFLVIINDLIEAEKKASLKELEVVMQRGRLEDLKKDDVWCNLSSLILDKRRDLITWRRMYWAEALSKARNVPRLFFLVQEIEKSQERIEELEGDRFDRLDNLTRSDSVE